MSQYLDRYLAGETTEVWAEIGPLTWSELSAPAQTDIQDVCEETMRRVRQNAERLIQGLNSIGFRFGIYPSGESYPDFSGPLTGPDPERQRKITNIESRIGSLPLTLRTFWAHIGEICLIGKYPKWPQYADPLVVDPVEATVVELDMWLEEVEDGGLDEAGPFRVPVAPDFYHKDNVSGGEWYGFETPCKTVDAVITMEPHQTTFVNYLRTALQAKGFPGLAEAPQALAGVDFSFINF